MGALEDGFGGVTGDELEGFVVGDVEVFVGGGLAEQGLVAQFVQVL